jgi:hypothetical protein
MVMMAEVPAVAEDRCARCPNRLTCRVAAFALVRRPAPPELQRRLSSLSAGRNTASSPSSGRNEQAW